MKAITARGLIIALAAALWLAAGHQAGALEGYKLLKLDGYFVKWGDSALGSGATVTYALVHRQSRFVGARNCAGMRPVEPLLSRIKLPSKRFMAEVETAFALWSKAANINFTPAADAADADILIGLQTEPRGRAFTNVSYVRQGAEGARRIDRSLICLNPRQPWKVGFDGDIEVYDLRYTLAHEIGHAIGLDHPAVMGQLMGFRYEENFRGPQQGDIGGAVALYGARPSTTAFGLAQAAAPRPGRVPRARAQGGEDGQPELSLGQSSAPEPPIRHPFSFDRP